MESGKDSKGITARKEDDFSEWYTQVVLKADLADYSAVSGCLVYKPGSYLLWEKIQAAVDGRLKKIGVQNCYFPLFIPESLLRKEAAHVQGFAPEVAWVTQGGNTPLGERLAVRPTSETIMYDSYAKWIRSHHDLPLRLNQWNNVVRWEFTHPTPFLRGREFLWNEGHTCFATKEEAEAEEKEIIGIYQEVCEKYLALPALIGRKSDREKFAGAEYTISLEFAMPNGKAVQGPDFHHDGQNFAKAFGITFLDKGGKKQYVWQNTWAVSTRMIGVLIAIHGDNKGMVLPPMLASTQVVIVPILFDESKKEVLLLAERIKENISSQGFTVHLDAREGYSAGWKFNEWEMKGVPLRIEIGPKDLKKGQAVLVRRDTGEKNAVAVSALAEEMRTTLDSIQQSLYARAEKMLKSAVREATSMNDAVQKLEQGKILFAPWCGNQACEDECKEKTAAKSLNSPLQQPSVKGKACFVCGRDARVWFYWGKSY